jgi:hypothetical protein
MGRTSQNLKARKSCGTGRQKFQEQNKIRSKIIKKKAMKVNIVPREIVFPTDESSDASDNSIDSLPETNWQKSEIFDLKSNY